jgi:hypothetical protein
MAKADVGIQVENIIGLAILTVEKDFGIAGLDHVLQVVESRRKTLLHDAYKERTWEPK